MESDASKPVFGGGAKPAGSLFGGPPAKGGSLFGGAPAAGGLFGNGTSFGGAPKTFGAPSGSLFSNTSNMFAKPEGAKKEEPKYGNDDGENSDGMYAEPDEPPTVTLGPDVSAANPFSKVYEKAVDKFKVTATAPANEK